MNETPQQRYRRVHKDRLLVKNRENMRKRRADPDKHAAHKASQRRTYYRTKYGMEPEDLDALYLKQDGRCKLCGIHAQAPTATCHRSHKLHVDHCHGTGNVRGLLCVLCNTALGKLGDSVESLERVLRYLKGEQL